MEDEERMEGETGGIYGPCGWCGKPSVDRIKTSSGRSKVYAPVCVEHEAHFAEQGVLTPRLAQDRDLTSRAHQREYLEKKRTGRW